MTRDEQRAATLDDPTADETALDAKLRAAAADRKPVSGSTPSGARTGR